MKALSVLLVLVLSKPCQADCFDTSSLAYSLAQEGYIITAQTPPNVIELVDFKHLRWIDVETGPLVSCILWEGRWI